MATRYLLLAAVIAAAFAADATEALRAAAEWVKNNTYGAQNRPPRQSMARTPHPPVSMLTKTPRVVCSIHAFSSSPLCTLVGFLLYFKQTPGPSTGS